MSKYRAKGTVLKKGATAIGQVAGIQGPGATRETIDATAHDSSGDYREFVGALIDAGEVTFKIQYDPVLASHRQLRADFDDGSVDEYSLTFTDDASTVATFDALVSGLSPTMEVEGLLEQDVTLKVSGPVKGLGGES